MNTMHLLAEYLRRPEVVLALVAVLAAWTVWSGVQLFHASAKLSQVFRRARARTLESDDEASFATGYELVSNAISRLPLVGPSWVGFTRTLVISEGRPVIATADPREWFDLADLFRDAGADLRYHAALPGLLVGAGLMFTFLGLAALTSASGVVADGVDQAQRNGALRDLLGAASVKFITSLAGLFLSIVYALFRKWRIRLVEQDLNGFRCQQALVYRDRPVVVFRPMSRSEHYDFIQPCRSGLWRII